MGLDMYLERCDRRAYGFKSIDVYEVKVNNPNLYNDLKPYLHERGIYHKWESLFEEVGYWRKANAIHRWFVENVQNDIDDCDRYEVDKEQLEALLSICLEIKNSVRMERGLVRNGEKFVDGEWEPIMEEGEYMINSEVARDLLPTQEGFFFGGTEYDQWYMQDIIDTIDIITKVLETTDFDREMITYCSSW